MPNPKEAIIPPKKYETKAFIKLKRNIMRGKILLYLQLKTCKIIQISNYTDLSLIHIHFIYCFFNICSK